MEEHAGLLAVTLILGIPIALASLAFPPLFVALVLLTWAWGRFDEYREDKTGWR